MGDDSRLKAAPARAAGDELRRWLRVPAALGIPAWARSRLQEDVRQELEARAGMPLERTVFGIVDLETTGTSAARHRILEIGLVVQRGGRNGRRFSTLVGVELPIPAWITALTGIQSSDTLDAPDEAEALTALADVLEEEGVQALVAHNAGFDRAFLERGWARHDVKRALPPFLCSLRLARRWIRAPGHGLDALSRQLGISARARHRALGDAEMTAVLWSELLQRGRLHGVHTLEALRDLGGVGRSRARTRVRLVDVDARIR